MESFELPDNDAVNFTLESYEQPDNDNVNFTPIPDETEPPQEDFELDINTVLLISSLIAGTLYATFRFRSVLSFFGWMLMIIAFLVALFTNLPLYWFWIVTIGELFILSLAYVAYTRAAARAKN